jgi:hypothetical protein
MRHRNCDILHATVEEHMEAQPVWVMQNWLLIHVPMAKHSVKEGARLAVRNVCTLVSYFWTQAPTQ